MNWKVGIIIAIVGISYAIFIGATINESNKCKRHIIFTDGTEMDCKSAESYDNGTTRIRTCDSKRIIVPTIRVKEILEIE